jgi:hypothetical protein
MFDDCNTFFKRKPDGRVAARPPSPSIRANDTGCPLHTLQFLHFAARGPAWLEYRAPAARAFAVITLPAT